MLNYLLIVSALLWICLSWKVLCLFFSIPNFVMHLTCSTMHNWYFQFGIFHYEFNTVETFSQSLAIHISHIQVSSVHSNWHLKLFTKMCTYRKSSSWFLNSVWFSLLTSIPSNGCLFIVMSSFETGIFRSGNSGKLFNASFVIENRCDKFDLIPQFNWEEKNKRKWKKKC